MQRVVLLIISLMLIFIFAFIFSISYLLGWNAFLIASDFINMSEAIYNAGKQMITQVGIWAPIAIGAAIVTIFLVIILLIMFSLRSEAEHGGGGFWPF